MRGLVGRCDAGQHALDNLPTWAIWITTAAVGIHPRAGDPFDAPIARLLRRLLWPRPAFWPSAKTELGRKEPADAPG